MVSMSAADLKTDTLSYRNAVSNTSEIPIRNQLENMKNFHS
jgi:hypothetical protein